MPPLTIVELLEVLEDLAVRLRPRGPARVVGQLDLHRGEEALRHGIIPAVTAPAHAADDPVCRQGAPIVGARVLGEFNRSSQHLKTEVLYGKAT